MVLKAKKMSDCMNMKVFTDEGFYFGEVEEAQLASNRIHGWRIRATKNSYLNKVLSGAKGVIVPHNLVNNIGDVFIVSRAAVPNYGLDEDEDED
ncbi:photosystem reaction center subunit H [archaeon]|nr:photosystem reaction center subunit H [archaeon]|tara:strand:+ start:776 stop:1057 length:282 start_codon:yes stop_codon:yes gene_type:complete